MGLPLGFAQSQAPSLPKANSADAAMLEAMLTEVGALTQAPHPAGSAENAKVRAALVQAIEAAGLGATVEDTVFQRSQVEAVWDAAGNGSLANLIAGPELDDLAGQANAPGAIPVHNILTVVRAPNPQGAALMVAHYDSTPDGPGAADDMVAVGAMLQAMRRQVGQVGQANQADQAVQNADQDQAHNDLYFLITDGEEDGLLGAVAFAKAHRDFGGTIDTVVNLEARGNKGGLTMFETSVGAEDEVRDFIAAGTHPIGTSLAAQIYRLMPNNTDFSVFAADGYHGINLAVIEGPEVYHEPSDTVENLDRGTAWHYLLTATGLAQFLANAELAGRQATVDAVYFPLGPGHMVIVAEALARVTGIVAALGALALLAWASIRRRIRVGRTVGVLGLQLGLTVLTMAVCWGVTALITPRIEDKPIGQVLAIAMGLFLALAVLASALVVLVWLRLTRRTTPKEVLAGVAGFLAILTLVTALTFTGGSYLFTLPLLGTVVVALAVALTERLNGRWQPIGRGIVVAAAGLLTALLFVPICWVVYQALLIPVGLPVAVGLWILPLTTILALSAVVRPGATPSATRSAGKLQPNGHGL